MRSVHVNDVSDSLVLQLSCPHQCLVFNALIHVCSTKYSAHLTQQTENEAVPGNQLAEYKLTRREIEFKFYLNIFVALRIKLCCTE